MSIYERINLITTAFKNLNGHIRKFGEPLCTETPSVKLTLHGVRVEVVRVAFNDLINHNLSMTINNPKFGGHYPVCLKLHITPDEKVVWHDEYVKYQAEDAVGVGITPDEVLDGIQESVSIALTNFVSKIHEDWKKIA